MIIIYIIVKINLLFCIMNISDYVYKENIFSRDFCSRKIEDLNQLNISEWKSHTWSSINIEDNPTHTRNIKDFSITYQEKISSDMGDGIIQFLTNYQKNTSKFFSISKISNIRFNKYYENQQMIEHVDHIYGIFDGQNKGIPVISILGVFNDDYEGGDFWLCGERIKLDVGDILGFPSVFLYPHKVSPIIKGSRYSWITWGY